MNDDDFVLRRVLPNGPFDSFTWTLVLSLITYEGCAALVVVPGFQSEAECEEAGKKWECAQGLRAPSCVAVAIRQQKPP